MSPPAAGALELFDADFLRRLENLKLVSKQLLPGAFKGEHRSRKRGSGIEFADYRPYVEGDSLRFVDWPAYLKFDKLLVRLFEEEGDLPVYLFLDSSGSMTAHVTSATDRTELAATKADYARRIVAAFAYIGLTNLDRVSITAYADGMRDCLDTIRGPGQIIRALRFLEGLEFSGESDIGAALVKFFERPRRRGLVVVVSDFYDASADDGLRRLFQRRHDVLLVAIRDPSDSPPDIAGRVELIDSESGRSSLVMLDPALVSAYREELEETDRQLQSLCKRRNWSFLEASTQVAFDELILEVFKQGRLLR